MADTVSDEFVQRVNQHLGIAHKVGRVYFPDETEREDVVQEMMYQLWRSYAGFDGRSKFSTWMYKVCLNTALTYRRKQKNEKMEPISDTHHEIAVRIETDQPERIRQLWKAIATLSSLNKAIVLLYLENLSYDEIAAVTGLTRSNVSVRLVRIKKELEILLKSTI